MKQETKLEIVFRSLLALTLSAIGGLIYLAYAGTMKIRKRMIKPKTKGK